MEISVIQTKNKTIIECGPKGCFIQQEQDILDLIALCGENGTNLLLLDESNLSSDFFDLKTGLAGAIFQKLANYFVRAAVVISFDKIESERFKELMSEYNKGNDFRFYGNKDIAIEWLAGL